jgi:Concanavalin A-like lectin/glucanases superfamily
LRSAERGLARQVAGAGCLCLLSATLSCSKAQQPSSNGSAVASARGARQSNAASTTDTIVWTIDNTSRIHGFVPIVLGAPTVTDTEQGRATCFDGMKDALIFPANPLQGLSRFTVEVLFRPDAGGAAEQRFVHIQEAVSENRALIETRVSEQSFYLDTFLRFGTVQQALVRPNLTHALGEWHWAALRYADKQMSHFVGGVEEVAAELDFPALGPGQMSLGVRLNRRYWFKGCIRELRFSGVALPTAALARIAKH